MFRKRSTKPYVVSRRKNGERNCLLASGSVLLAVAFSFLNSLSCPHQMAKTDANPGSRLCSQEDHPCCAHRQGLSAAAQEHVLHHSSQEYPPYEAGNSAGPMAGSFQPHGHVQGTPHQTGLKEERGE